MHFLTVFGLRDWVLVGMFILGLGLMIFGAISYYVTEVFTRVKNWWKQ